MRSVTAKEKVSVRTERTGMREPGTMLTIAPWVGGVQRHPLKRGRQSLRKRRDYIRGPYSVPKESESMGGPLWPCLHHKDSGQSRKKK